MEEEINSVRNVVKEPNYASSVVQNVKKIYLKMKNKNRRKEIIETI